MERADLLCVVVIPTAETRSGQSQRHWIYYPTGDDLAQLAERVRAAPGGIACGTQTGTNTGIFKFDDSFAHLSGFPPDQEAWGKASIAKPNSSCNQELEILLRWTSSAHRATG